MDDTVSMSTRSGDERRPRAPAPDGADGRPRVRWGFGVGLALAADTAVTFALALTAVPDDVPYPFTSDLVAAQWPGDYLWMYPAMLLMLLFVAFAATVHQFAPRPRAMASLLGLCFACVAATVLLIDYFIQVTAVPLSLEKGQLDGWAMLTMYNPHGVFIALEELGYLLMSLTLALLSSVFNGRNRLEHTIRWLFRLSLAAVVGALVVVSWVQGMDRADVFETIAVSIVWLTILVGAPLVAVVLRRTPDHS